MERRAVRNARVPLPPFRQAFSHLVARLQQVRLHPLANLRRWGGRDARPHISVNFCLISCRLRWNGQNNRTTSHLWGRRPLWGILDLSMTPGHSLVELYSNQLLLVIKNSRDWEVFFFLVKRGRFCSLVCHTLDCERYSTKTLTGLFVSIIRFLN